jgi:hypothetical protein
VKMAVFNCRSVAGFEVLTDSRDTPVDQAFQPQEFVAGEGLAGRFYRVA